MPSILENALSECSSRVYGDLGEASVQVTHHCLEGLRLRTPEMAVEQMRPFAGEVEIDELIFGAPLVRGMLGSGSTGKPVVIGPLKRGG